MSEIQKKQKKGIEITPKPTVGLPATRIYSNFVEVIHSPYDFTLRFCDATPIYNIEEVEQNDGVHKIPIATEVTIPFDVVKPLINALQDQYKKYKKITDKISGKKQLKK